MNSLKWLLSSGVDIAKVHGDSATGARSKTGFLSKALAYLNVDVGVSGPYFGASGTPTLVRVLAGVLGQVKKLGDARDSRRSDVVSSQAERS